jgi:hypothetical protein
LNAFTSASVQVIDPLVELIITLRRRQRDQSHAQETASHPRTEMTQLRSEKVYKQSHRYFDHTTTGSKLHHG